jgi:hypothetical protein
MAEELGPRLMSLEQRLLDDVGRIELGLPARIKLEPGQQQQILAELLELLSLRLAYGGCHPRFAYGHPSP